MTRAALCRDRYPDLSPSEIGKGLHNGSVRFCEYGDGLRIDTDHMLEGMLHRDMRAGNTSIDPDKRCLSIIKIGTCPDGLPVAVIAVNDGSTSMTDTVRACTYCNMAGMCGNPTINKNLYDMLNDDPEWNGTDDDDD